MDQREEGFSLFPFSLKYATRISSEIEEHFCSFRHSMNSLYTTSYRCRDFAGNNFLPMILSSSAFTSCMIEFSIPDVNETIIKNIISLLLSFSNTERREVSFRRQWLIGQYCSEREVRGYGCRCTSVPLSLYFISILWRLVMTAFHRRPKRRQFFPFPNNHRRPSMVFFFYFYNTFPHFFFYFYYTA